MRRLTRNAAFLPLVLLLPFAARATETENLGLQVLPAPGKVTVDGGIGDWDLTGGVFVCSQVERLRETYAVWLHAMHDAKNVYVLCRWIDPTPMNHPGSIKGSYGFHGDCLQVRFITGYETPAERVSHWTCWMDCEGQHVMDVAYGRDFKGGSLADAQTEGAQQAFRKSPDGSGYVQELAIPWKLLTSDGSRPRAGQTFRTTVEPNFTRGAQGRLSIKGIFLPGVPPDRIFTFRAYRQWGRATLEAKGAVKPRPVRLADGREFPVTLQDGLPVVDWSGLIRNVLWPGFKPIRFTMPFDGYVSLNLLDAEGRVARQLLTMAFLTKGGQEVQWDGLTTPYVKQPGEPVPPGTYRWQAIAHPGIGLRLRGWAHHGGSHPWNAGPGTGWGGNHGVPVSCAADKQKVYLGWSGAEGPAPLVACDLDGKVQWRSGMGGKDEALLLAVDGATVYAAFHGGAALFRLDAKKGNYTSWQGRDDTVLRVGAIWPEPQGLPTVVDGMDAADGRLYLGFASHRLSEDSVGDWRPLLERVASGEGLGADIWNRLQHHRQDAIKKFLAGKLEAERVDRGAIVHGLNGLLDRTDLVPDGERLSRLERQAANLEVLKAAFPGALAPARTDLVAVVDAQDGKLLHQWPVPGPLALAAQDATRVLVLSKGTEVLALDPSTGRTQTVLRGLTNARDVAVDAKGNIYVVEGSPDNQVKVFSPAGKRLRAMGRKGGRDALGPWVADAMRNPSSLVVDTAGKVWVTESDHTPKRIVVWDGATGKLVRELFGPTHYGASGGAIHPRDPNLMVGSACEWRIDPATGRATCLGVFDTTLHGYACFREGGNGRTYLFAKFAGHLSSGHVRIFERLGDGRYARRAEIRHAGSGRDAESQVWADRNGDGQEQPDETRALGRHLQVIGSNGWSLNVGLDLALYSYDAERGRWERIAVAGFTPCGAPRYDFARAERLPESVAEGSERAAKEMMPTPDGRKVLANQAVESGLFWRCYDVATGRRLWSYPNPFFQVHGSHRAPSAQPGLFRGAYGMVGIAALPEPVGAIWVINTNVGEWHVLTERGFYLTRLFQPDPLQWDWPERAVPGAVMDDVPPGSGSEDFGGSMTQGKDGEVYVQSGKSAYWNLKVVGLDRVVALPGGTVAIAEADIAQAEELRERALQAAVGVRRYAARKLTPTFTGDLERDFLACPPAVYEKQRGAGITTVAAWDDSHLYVGWRVEDASPWRNSAKDPALMYAGGDTVDLQLGTDPKAPKDRREAGQGDLRISIGNFQGKPVPMVYRRIAKDKRPKTFSSGVVAEYRMDYVAPLEGARVHVEAPERGRHYAVEAAIPFASLGMQPKPGLKLQADFGATHSDPAGRDTVLRTHWSNQVTGLVDDVVFELKMEPRNWGELLLAE